MDKKILNQLYRSLKARYPFIVDIRLERNDYYIKPGEDLIVVYFDFNEFVKLFPDEEIDWDYIEEELKNRFGYLGKITHIFAGYDDQYEYENDEAYFNSIEKYGDDLDSLIKNIMINVLRLKGIDTVRYVAVNIPE